MDNFNYRKSGIILYWILRWSSDIKRMEGCFGGIYNYDDTLKLICDSILYNYISAHSNGAPIFTKTSLLTKMSIL